MLWIKRSALLTCVTVLSLVVVIADTGQISAHPARDDHAVVVDSAESEHVQLTQRGRRGQGFWGRFWRGLSRHQKNHADVKAAYQDAAAAIAGSTARVLLNDEQVALATVVDKDGYLVTKASLLGRAQQVNCRFDDDPPSGATVVGRHDAYDIALLKIDGAALPVAAWREEVAGPGTIVAAVDSDGDVISMGIVSTESRPIGGGDGNPRRAWLGVQLGDGSAGTMIAEVLDGGAAKQAGLQRGDTIQTIDGEPMKSLEQIVRTIGKRYPRDRIVIKVQRGEETLELKVTLGRPPSDVFPQDHWGGGPFSVRREGFPEVILHDTIIKPEQCGGPLVDTDGNIVGINIARALRVTSYAVPAAIVQRLVKELKKS